MVKDNEEILNATDVADAAAPSDVPEPKMTAKGRRSMQGPPEQPAQEPTADVEPVNSGEKGSQFQKWAEENVFHGKGRRLTVRPEDNRRLDRLGDGVGISKQYRQSDSYLDDDGQIYELKSGYEKGGIDKDQAFEYSLMQDARYVKVRQGDRLVKTPVNLVCYIFDSKAGAEANRATLDEYGLGILYKDDKGVLRSLDSE